MSDVNDPDSFLGSTRCKYRSASTLEQQEQAKSNGQQPTNQPSNIYTPQLQTNNTAGKQPTQQHLPQQGTPQPARNGKHTLLSPAPYGQQPTNQTPNTYTPQLQTNNTTGQTLTQQHLPQQGTPQPARNASTPCCPLHHINQTNKPTKPQAKTKHNYK